MWELDYKESWTPKNWCFWTVVLEKTLESPLDYKEVQPVNPTGNHSWIFCWGWNSNTLATWCEELTHLKRLLCWEGLKVEGEGDDRGWDGWMPSLMQWTWVWVGSQSWWWTGKPGALQSMGSHWVRHNCATDLNWLIAYFNTYINNNYILLFWRFPGGSDGREYTWNVGDPGSIPGSGISPGEGNGNPLQYSCLENSMDRGAWWAIVYRITKSQTRLSNYHFHFHSLFSIINLDITISKSLRMVAER